MRTLSLIIVLCLILSGCQTEDTAEHIVKKSIEHYFPTGLEHKKITFDFRDRTYSIERYPSRYIYTRSFEDSTGYVQDVLVNSNDLTRLINQDTTPVTEEWKKKYASSINSVLYFFQIPFVLTDPAAHKKLVGEVKIKGKNYWSVKVTFSEEKGGEDYDDQYIYWISKDDYAIDYFAYNYTVDGGGVRFREAINQRRIDSLLFQDYINYEVKIGTPLESIPELFEAGKLKELSKIINENISVTPL